jgi:hypothetical protein
VFSFAFNSYSRQHSESCAVLRDSFRRAALPKGMHMRGCLGVIMIYVAVVSASGQTPSSKYQPGTITAVTPRQGPGQHETDVTQYDVSVKVGDTTYVVLYTPPNRANTVKFSAGLGLLVLVGSNTLTFNSVLSGKTEVPILSRETLPAKRLDSSQFCGEYFSKKLQHLSEILALTDDQQAQVKPVLEQETGELGQICFNPVLSPKEKLNLYKKIVRVSDEKIKPLLSAPQLQRLQDLRKEQKRNLEGMFAKQKAEQN